MMSITSHGGNEGETPTMSFKDKKKFFEQEIAGQASGQPKYKSERKFSYLQEHEVAKLRTEEEKKLSHTSKEEMLSQMTETLHDQDMNRMMTSLGGGGSPRTVVKRSDNHGRRESEERNYTNGQTQDPEIQNGGYSSNGVS